MKKGEDFTGITIVYACHDGQGKYLFNKRSQNCRDERGTWDCGGGALELHDTVEDTLRKELKEEYGVDIIESEFLGFRDMHRTHEGRPTHWLALDFKIQVDPAQAINGEPHKFEEIAWYAVDDIPEPLHTGLVRFIERYRGQL